MKFKPGDVVTYKGEQYMILDLVRVKARANTVGFDGWEPGYAYTSPTYGESGHDGETYVRLADDFESKFEKRELVDPPFHK